MSKLRNLNSRIEVGEFKMLKMIGFFNTNHSKLKEDDETMKN